VPACARQRGGDHAGVPHGPQAQSGQRRDAESGRHQRLNRNVVVGGERDPRGEAGRLALPDQVGAAALAAGDPAAARVRREACNRHRVARRSVTRGWARAARGRGLGDQVHRLVEQQHAAGALVGWLGRLVVGVLLVVPEDDRDVHVASSQHPQRLGWLRLRQHELQARRLGAEPGRGRRDQRAERGRERRQPHPAAAQPDVGRQLSLGRVEPADDLLGPLGQQLTRLRQPDSAPDALQELGTGFRLKPGDVMADRRLGVIKSTRCGRHRAVPRDRDQHPEPGHIQHCSTIGRLDGSAASPLGGVSVRLAGVGAAGRGGPAQRAGPRLLEFPAW